MHAGLVAVAARTLTDAPLFSFGQLGHGEELDCPEPKVDFLLTLLMYSYLPLVMIFNHCVSFG